MFITRSPLHDKTVTVHAVTIGPPDENGTPVETTVEVPWSGVNIQQIKAELLTDDDRNTSRSWYRVSGPTPAGIVLNTADRITWDGVEYSIDGEPDTRSGAYRINHTSLRMYQAQG